MAEATSMQVIVNSQKNHKMSLSDNLIVSNLFDYGFEKEKNFEFYYPDNNCSKIVEKMNKRQLSGLRSSFNNKKKLRSRFSSQFPNLLNLKKAE